MTSQTDRAEAAGFTLLETLVVLTILGLVLALFASRGADHNKSLVLRAAGDNLAESLRLARTDAILHARAAIVTISADPPGWSDPAGVTTRLATGISVSAETAAAFGAVAATDRISFEPDGSSSGGDIILGSGSQDVTVEIDWLTGRVSVSTPVSASP